MCPSFTTVVLTNPSRGTREGKVTRMCLNVLVCLDARDRERPDHAAMLLVANSRRRRRCATTLVPRTVPTAWDQLRVLVDNG